MGNVVAIKSKTEAAKVLDQHHELVNQNNVRDTVRNALCKLDEVNGRIEKIEKRGFFKRMVGGVTGSNQKEIVAAMRDISESQNITVQLVISLAIMHSQNQYALNDILDELEQSKGTYTRITDHIQFLYNQVESIKKSYIKKPLDNPPAKKKDKKVIISVGVAVIIILGICLFSLYR
ncbi:hypothetical protein [Bacillus sp. AG4(2022)]|uniref:hypothetical protein n=1 Tax=Bacillus sp. AG4(2022) TaxID=2962594 RepID=UPI0028818F45|nr:hypothetical protein [Bacillus sp. AG4(2022)]MDT0160704.1 hypothetical protein [Bacillus sp. AG4(2022)]